MQNFILPAPSGARLQPISKNRSFLSCYPANQKVSLLSENRKNELKNQNLPA